MFDGRNLFDQARRRQLKLAVIIPALDEQETIGDVVAAVPRRIVGVHSVDVIVIDDGSRDETSARAFAAGADAVVRHTGSRGLPRAFNDGVTEALRRGADIVVNLDGDGQHDPRYVPRLIAPIVSGAADMAVAVRPLRDRSQGTRIRRIGNRFGSSCMRRVLGIEIADVTSGFRAFSRETLLAVHVVTDYTYTLETLIQAARKRLLIAEVEVAARPRAHGTSRMTHSIWRYIARTGGQALRSLLHSDPLRIFGRLSAVSAAGSVLTTVWFMAGYARGGMHLPALLAAGVLAGLATMLFVCGLLADGISTNRRLLEDTLGRIKRMESESREPAADDVAVAERGAVPLVEELAQVAL